MRYAVRVTGIVQGVGFRYTVCRTAEEEKLTGWVKNEWDGSVSIEAQGQIQNLERFLREIQERSRWADIDHLEHRRIAECSGESSFHVKY
ncbi:MAG: acylphosphatase [Oscillospiraceae bacterium]|nr:acylphosphatase [Oscillospiraceae bacterium]